MLQSISNEKMTLNQALNILTVERLTQQMKFFPSLSVPKRKAELVEVLESQLTGKSLKSLWNSLGETAQAAVAEAIHNNEGEYRADLFLAKYGFLPDWGEELSGKSRYSAKLSRYSLFFFPLRSYDDEGYQMPRDMVQELRAYVPPPIKLTLKSSEQPPNTIQVSYIDTSTMRFRLKFKPQAVDPEILRTEHMAQQDLLGVLRLVHLGKVSVSDKTLMPSKAAMKAIAGVLQPEDYYNEDDLPSTDRDLDPIGAIKPFAWAMLLQGGGLASLTGKKLQLTPAGKKALNAPPEKTIKAIWSRWLKTKVIDELRRTENIKGQTGKGKRGLTALASRRNVINLVLTDCPVGRWVSLENLIRYFIASSQVFTVSRYPENLYLCESGYGSFYDVPANDWSLLQGCYLRCLLFEYAATLGLIDVAYIIPHNGSSGEWDDFWGADNFSFLSRYDGLLAIQLNALGAYCLGLTATYEASSIVVETSLRVLPNLEIVLTGSPLKGGETLLMQTFTNQVSESVWTLDRAIALKAVAQGHSLEDFRDFLTEASVDPLPDTVSQFFADCISRSQGIQDQGLARLFECSDQALATLIAHDSRTKKYCQLAGDRQLIVPVDQETRFRNALQKVGYTLPGLN